jgi:hypothetical protein|tara:strand:- start:4672 stop:5589 length:918 start_codon:yes stop_codon:yes gene_type:complete
MDIRLYFHEFWGGFNKQDNFFVWILSQNHNVTVVDSNPNLVISLNDRPFPDVYTIYFNGGEPYFPVPTPEIADHFLGGFFLDYPNYTRFPAYYQYVYEFIKNGLIKDFSFFTQENRPIPPKTKFCSYVSRSLHGKRGRFFHKLNNVKKVETNVHPFKDFSIPFDNTSLNSSLPKINFIKDYKFNIAFENNFRATYPSYPNAVIENGEMVSMNGMISEKFIEPFISGVIPIYWGNDRIHEEYNPNSFLNYFDFESDEELIEKILEIDSDDKLYQSYFKEPIVSNKQSNVINLDYLINLFENIIQNI